MPPAPTVSPDLVRQTITDMAARLGRPVTSEEVADELSAKLGRPVKPDLVRSVKSWYSLEAPLVPEVRRRPVVYRLERALGAVRPEHYRSHYWYLGTVFERQAAGLMDSEALHARKARELVADLLHSGDVLDYSEHRGLHRRPGWPWELGDYLAERDEKPEGWRERLLGALRAPGGRVVGKGGERHTITEEHRRAWERALREAIEEIG